VGPTGCTETSVGRATTRCLITQTSAVLIYFAAEAWNHLSSTEVWRDKDHFFSVRTSSYHAHILTIPCSVVTASCSFHSMSSNSLMRASVSPSPSSPPAKPAWFSP
jgi:3-polyprenyl-4-hydroxybenzoate decarboxylase